MLTNIDNEIRSQLTLGNEADPDAIATRMLQHGNITLTDEFLEWALAERIRLLQRTIRNLPEPVKNATNTAKGRSRWAQVREVAPFVNKFVDELTEADIITIINSYNVQANAAIDKANEYRKMLEDLKASGCSTIGEMQARTGVLTGTSK